MSDRPENLDAAMRALLEVELAYAALSQVGAERAPSCAPDPQPVSGGGAEKSADPGQDQRTALEARVTPPRFSRAIADIASTVLKIPADRMDTRENMSRYGVDSIIVTEIMKRVSDVLDLPIAPTVFFEARHLEELADILYQRYEKSIAPLYAERPAASGQPAGSPQARAAPPDRDRTREPDAPVAAIAPTDVGDTDARRWVEKFRAIASSAAPSRAAAKPDYEPIAIIAMDGVFADSANILELEKHLRNGDDCIREVPSDRWNWRDVFGDPRHGECTNVKYGGFAPDIDKFDPLFFGMSPREAEMMDPQHRMFIQCVWRLIETAGYAPRSLAGRKVGLFIGINLQDYAHIVDRTGAIEAAHLTSLGHMFCPNRLSFILDIHGPSQVIDTACSSSLVALHRAVLSIQHEGCEMAIAGGANLMISPDMHIMYSKLGMICEDGRCKTFSKAANGYARGDGVGAVLLKSLSRAERDGDTILAVIRGSAENHGGMSTSLTAPNPRAQASLIVEAHGRAGIDPRSVGMIECHGTGTSLGDPIEINGLKMAFEELHRSAGVAAPEAPYCGLGSLKSNIGHAETTAGLAGVIKAVLSIRNRQLYPTLHADDINPLIELAGSPFFVLQRGRAWTRPLIDGRELPLRAGVSSFGAGGSNAHVVIEEYIGRPSTPAARETGPSLILLSAKTEERLREVVGGLLRFLDETPAGEMPAIGDVAYTLQVGREALEWRLALVANSVADLKAKLASIHQGDEAVPDCVSGVVKRGKATSRPQADSHASPATIATLFAAGDVRRLADLWTRGSVIDWQLLYADPSFKGRRPRRVALPAYPFARQRYWLPESAAGQLGDRRRGVVLHPLLHQNTSSLAEQRFSSVFSGREFFLADHVVMGERVLPGVAYLEMARAAVKQAGPQSDPNRVHIRLKNVVWSRPFMAEQPRSLHIGLYDEGKEVAYRIYSTSENEDDTPVLHSQGTAMLQDPPSSRDDDRLDPATLLDTITKGEPQRYRLDGRQCYEAFRVIGIAYGPGHQGLESVYYSPPGRTSADATNPQVLAKLHLPPAAERSAAQFVLHPGLMDSALQACIGLMAASGHALPTGDATDASVSSASLPFALEEFELLAQPPSTLWAWIRHADGCVPSDKLQKFHIDLCDEQGRICVRMRGFSSRSPERAQPAEANGLLLCDPVWVDRPISDAADGATWSRHSVLLCDLDGTLPASIEREIAAAVPGVTCQRLRLRGGIADWYADGAVRVFQTIKDELLRKDAARTLVQVVIPRSGDAILLGGLSGLLKTANRESARVFAQLIEMDESATASGVVGGLIAESRSGEAHIRYERGARQALVWQEASRAQRPAAPPWKDGGVYLITGGSGGLALLLAKQIAASTRNARIVLCGRSEPGARHTAKLDQLRSDGTRAEYRQCDVSRRDEVDALVTGIVQTHGRLNGVLHCAGLLRDNFIPKKTAQDFADVLAPKVAGTIHLDEATAHLNLDVFALFSSAAGALGSVGQADYAAANAFMDAFARRRNRDVGNGRRQGRTVSVNWPLWADGGMRMEPAALAMMRQTTGMDALPAEAGLDAFNDIMASGASQVLVLYGQTSRMRQLLKPAESPARAKTRDRDEGASVAAPSAGATELKRAIAEMLLQAVASTMKFELKDLDVDAEWNDYGFDSISLTEFSNRLNERYRLGLAPTAFFEHSTVSALAAWLAVEHASALSQALGLISNPLVKKRPGGDAGAQGDGTTRHADAPASRRAPLRDAAANLDPPRNSGTAVAIIGMSGRFPMARDIDAFWDNLVCGRNCITEIPPDRWDWRALYGDPSSEPNKTNIKWGGFIDGVGDFDARFFNISPREAERMDPQQRLLMHYAWKAIEDAGYSPSSLSGTNTAMFVGTASSGYGEMMAKGGTAIESHSSTGTVGSIGPNRMSYFLNLHGPSEPIETACSSSLVAIHRALSAMANGDCDQAVVGGINLIISPETHVSFNKAGMLCPDGRCKTFSKDANGYVRGEGVGMLLLKNLDAAEAAGDHIYGVIRGSAENHGGRGNSLTAPNPKAQAELLKTAYARAGIDPRTVGYIEAHGTGTELGDPIEINGLKTAFRDLYQSTGTTEIRGAHCGLGSVKTNIGHLELAAGIAGVIKVLLQLKHKTLVRSLHCDAVNPYIQLEGSPFHLLQENRPWAQVSDDEGRVLPRRAGVSSFGFGGVNAHVVIEEYPEPQRDARSVAAAASPSLIVLSAKDPDRLKAYARDLLSFVSAGAATEQGRTVAAADPAHRALLDKTRAAIAEILRVDASQIEPAHPLDEYGFDPLHRTMLQEKLETAFGMDLGARPFFDNHTVASIADAVRVSNAKLCARLIHAADATPIPEPDQQRLQAGDMAGGSGFALADLAYTLQVGRDPMDERLAVIANSPEDLKDRLAAFVEGRTEAVNGLYVGRKAKSIAATFGDDEELQEALEKWIQHGKFSKLLDLWVNGLNLDWERLYGETRPYPFKPRRISAPGHPFAERRYWIEAQPLDPAIGTSAQAAAPSALHPLLHENISTLDQVRFGTRLAGTEFFLADHRMRGQKVLPGVAYLEMARAAVSKAADTSRPDTVFMLRDVVWISPAIVDQPRRIEIDLTAGAHGVVRYEVASSVGSDRQVHSQGSASLIASARSPDLDPDAVRARGRMVRVDDGLYARFTAAGLDYGPAHQGIRELHAGAGEVLAKLELPLSVAETLDQYVLHPSLMDCALQASIGLALEAGAGPSGVSPKLALPFAVDSVAVFGRCTKSMWAWVRRPAGVAHNERIQKLDIDLCDERGQVCVQIAGFSSRVLDAGKTSTKSELEPARAQPPPQPSPLDPADLKNRTTAYFKEHLATVLKFPLDDIRVDEALDSYGIDSMLVVELTNALEKPFGALSKTLFFEHQTLGELVDYFLDAHRPQLLKLFDDDKSDALAADAPLPLPAIQLPARNDPPARRQRDISVLAPALPNAAALDIAVIGLSGRYPQSPDIEAYWRNLRDGKDCITEIPPERWDWRAYYSEDRNQPGLHSCKWGGFIDGADTFDPLFFNIAPSAAEYMDPQERLFLEHAWTAIEDAGYRRQDLQAPLRDERDDEDLPAQVGVYAGVMYAEYQLLGFEASLGNTNIASTNFYASIANRVSYALNLHGPSMAVDTMCSSSLTAIHLACQDLKLGRTDMALAGGVNLNVHPNKYSLLSLGQFISSHGKCESFGAGGDGYVPSEGVGVVMLKRLADAERDGDHIYGVIKSSALNHGGKTNGYSVPNPKAQQAVIRRALREAGIDPRAIGYIEAHGTGTRLGDPIEIAGLAKAFAKHMHTGQSCWIGSSKSNIGHSEAAAGIAGLSKVLLQMRERRIVPSLHSGSLNPNIDFSAAPFEVNQTLREWPRPVVDGHMHPRAAGISSFGAGGSNAHLIVEEYVRPETAAGTSRPIADAACAIVLSARSEPQLRQYAERLLRFVRDGRAKERPAPSLRDLAYTLQVGREAMQHRLGFVATSMQDVADKLSRFLAGDHGAVHVGRMRAGVVETPPAASVTPLVASWVDGADVDWLRQYADDDVLPARVSLPTYPFARERYWVTQPEPRRVADHGHGGQPVVAEVIERQQPLVGSGDTLMLRQTWIEQAITAPAQETAYREHRVLAVGDLPEIPGAIAIALRSDAGTVDRCFTDYAAQVFEEIKDIVRRKPAGPVLLQIVTGTSAPSGCPEPLLGALAAMLKTARMENPRIIGQVIDLGGNGSRLSLVDIAGRLQSNGQAPHEPHVRYRGGRREVPVLAELDVASAPAQPVWRQGGTYLITGGAGGLGLIFAREIVRQVGDARLVLTGRSQLNEACRAHIEALRAEGARVEYRAADVSDEVAVKGLIESIGSALNGIIHSAGLIRDNFILRKTASDLRDVLAPKVAGVVNLDLATRSLDLDFFVLFSSLAGAVGNPGQSDYATANAFLDAYAAYRNRLASDAAADDSRMTRPKGQALSINWPLWREGGMDIDAESKELMWRNAGLTPLATEAGVAAFYGALQSGADQVMPLQGDVSRVRQLFCTPKPGTAPVTAPLDEVCGEPASGPGQGTSRERLVEEAGQLITRLLSDMLKLPLHRIESSVPLEEYGVDSVSMMKLTNDLEKILGPLSKTLFFEHPTIEAVSAHLAATFAPQLTARLAPEPEPAARRAVPQAEPMARTPQPAPAVAIETGKDEVTARQRAASGGAYDVAVIGMSGRFPQAKDLDEFWRNLAQGRDCITEIPAERWDHRAYFDPDKDKAGKTYCKWGGFLDEVDRFDSAFFKISPDEAELLDPQERVFLETVWNLFESSGYLGETLQRRCQSRVGVFVGSMSQQYHALNSDLVRESLVVMSSPSSIANRVSYFFNLQGPSIAIDTMCSAALNAVHMACESLLRGECRIAVAGGVNLTIHPKKYIGLSFGQMIGSHPDSTSFGDGDGYLPAEAVGAVLLKPLSEAISDGDTVLAVIKSTAVNHGGQSSGYRIPNGSAQAELIADNFARAEIDPRTVSYVESAANGSPLGDAIELNALTAGFRRYTDERQFCAIGSVKSNIGHAEAASGMSQLIKVILQLQHRQLAPTIKAEPLNPNIAFEQTPFYLQRHLEDWRRPAIALDGGTPREYPRRATVSSFGAGGSNAHLIIEEHDAAGRPAPAERADAAPHLILLSAKTAGQRDAMAQRLLAFVEQRQDLEIADLAYTLQTAREMMDYRSALVAERRDDLIQGLQTYLRNGTRGAGSARIFVGDSEQDTSGIRQLLTGKTGQATLAMLLAERDIEKLAFYWVSGARIAWQPLHEGREPRRIALPGYPFDRRRHWLPASPRPAEHAKAVPEPVEPFAVDPQRSVRDNMERYLTHGLSRLLGIPADEARGDKTFLDYGVDSISLTRLRRGLEQAFQVSISARDVIAHPTLSALAAFAAARHGPSPDVKKKTGNLSATEFDSTASALSEGQKGLWLLHQMAPGMSAYNVPVVLRLGPGLDAELFRQACGHVLRRFPVLGAAFRLRDGELYQEVPSDAPLPFEHERTQAASESEILDVLRIRSKQPFDLEHGPLWRVLLLTPVSDTVSYALITVHHIVFDGTSAVLLLRALMDAYRCASEGRAPETPIADPGYQDFVRWQHDFMASAGAGGQLSYWKAQLSGDLEMLSLPFDKPRSARQSFDGASHEITLPTGLASMINVAAKALQVSLATVFLGALKLLLHRYSGQQDILVGMPTLGRPEARFDDVLGYFVNMIVLRSRINGQQETAEFLKTLQLTLADGLDNADYPFPALLKELSIDRGRASSPLSQVLFAYQNFIQSAGWDDPGDTPQASLPVKVLPGVTQEGGHELALEVYQDGDGFRVSISYDTGLFGPETIRSAMAHYVRLLEKLASQPDACLADHAVLTPSERQRILAEWSARDAAGSEPDGSIIDVFQRQAGLTPEGTALVFAGSSLSYRDLERESSQLASLLLDRGVVNGDPVAVCIERGPDMIVAMLATWKAGGVYVPVAPDCPAERFRYLLGDSGAKLVITDAATRDRLTMRDSGTVQIALVIDEVRQEMSGVSVGPAPPARGEDPAYVIYTSGSTGQPKGVVISHRAIAHHCLVMRDVYQLTPEDRILQFASLAVDASLEQILPGLLCGATIVVRPDPLWSTPTFRREVASRAITIIDVPPSYLHELLRDTRDRSEWDALKSVRLAITGGEALMPETLGLWRDGPLQACRLVNAYGPTETTITSTVFEIEADVPVADAAGNVPIGRPLPGEQAFILDAYGHPVPVGVPGELHIGGAGLAIGYLNQPELTRQKFIDSPVHPGERIYKTGDRACWRADGAIVFLGRGDHQVKVRGYRVECGEIEAALRALASVRHAAVLLRPVQGGEQLVAFVVPAAERDKQEPSNVRRELATTLPDYMIPAQVVWLAEMPLTAGGKVDRAALMHRDLDAPAARSHTAPRNEIEARLANIWRQVLEIEQVGVYDNFFDLGGHSLLAVRLGAHIHKQFGRDLSISSLFEAPDIAGQARILQEGERTWSPLVCLQPNGDKTPWFCVHAVSGNVLSYWDLAREMGRERPVYALQAPEVGNGHPGTVEGLAAIYVDAIRSAQPSGPYHLGGWSMGGVIAYEMARQLEEAGEQVATVTLIDSYTPEAARDFEQGGDDEPALRAAFAREPGLEDAAALLAREKDVGSAHAHRLFEAFQANIRAMNRYVPGPCRSNVTLFAASGTSETSGMPGDHRHGDWASAIQGDFVTVSVAGDHYGVMRDPHVRTLSAALLRCIDGNSG